MISLFHAKFKNLVTGIAMKNVVAGVFLNSLVTVILYLIVGLSVHVSSVFGVLMVGAVLGIYLKWKERHSDDYSFNKFLKNYIWFLIILAISQAALLLPFHNMEMDSISFGVLAAIVSVVSWALAFWSFDDSKRFTSTDSPTKQRGGSQYVVSF